MRGAWIAIAAGVVCLGAVSPLRAGIYSTVEPHGWQPVIPFDELDVWSLSKAFDRFQRVLGEFRGASSDLPNRLSTAAVLATAEIGPGGPVVPCRLLAYYHGYQPYLQRPSLAMLFVPRAVALEAKGRQGGLTVEDRINLSYYYLYLGRPNQAIELLNPVVREGQPHFMALANLATAYEMKMTTEAEAGIPERALNYRSQALAAWPRGSWPGWTSEQLRWYLKAEKYHLNLLQLRAQGTARSPRPSEGLDSLFPKVRFVGPSGEYEAGRVAHEQWVEIPADAIPIVSQLLLWMPNDHRLYWLLGELLNAQGNVVDAANVLGELVNPQKRNVTAWRELRRHNQVLQAALPQAEKDQAFARDAPPLFREGLLRVLAPPPGIGLAPGAGPLAQASGWQAELYCLEKMAANPAGSANGTPATMSQGAPRAAALPDWRHLAVAFVAGVIVTLFAQMQLREMRRRRQGAAAESRG